MTQPVEIHLETPPSILVEVEMAGAQGVVGANNVVVSETEPTNKYVNLIWINPSS